jgi:hypothetical protein
MGETKVVIAGRTPGGDNGPVALTHLPINETVSSKRAAHRSGNGAGYSAGCFGFGLKNVDFRLSQS